MTQLIDTIDVSNVLGEGPVWDDRLCGLWWTDIHARRLYFWDWETRSVSPIDLPYRLTALALTDEPDCLLAAFAAGFALFWPASAKVEWIHHIAPDYHGIRLNDGRMDRAGRFWCGSMIENADVAQGSTGVLYSLDASGQLTPHFDGIAISNSLCFSPDGQTAYFADTPTREIHRFALAANGTLGPRTIFATLSGGGAPDGSDIDSAGNLWNAEWGSGKLTCYAPDGSVKAQVSLPVSRPTCPAFGGPDMQHIFLTSSKLELDEAALAKEPDAGKVLILESDSAGLPAPRMALSGLRAMMKEAQA